MTLEILITDTYCAMSEVSSRILISKLNQATVKNEVRFNPGLASGETPIGVYNLLVDRQKFFDPSLVNTWNLDEYIGLPGKNSAGEQRLAGVGKKIRFQHRGIDPGKIKRTGG